MAADDSIIDSKQSGFVMDRGFYSKDNLQYLVKGGYRFIIALPMSLKYCQKLMEEHGQEIVNHSEYLLETGLPYGKAYETEELRFRMKVHLYHAPEKAMHGAAELYELLEAQPTFFSRNDGICPLMEDIYATIEQKK